MELNFAAALAALEQASMVRIANAARPPANYILNAFLPEMAKETYDARTGSMTVRATMAGLAGMDSPYPPSGLVELRAETNQTAKVANHSRLSEQALRDLQQLLMRLIIAGNGNTNETIAREALNFLDKVIVQAHLDTAEWMRGQALATGTLNWTFNQKSLAVDYGIPSGNKLANRTSTAAYGGNASVFWSDVAALQKLLRYNVRAFLVHPDLMNVIVSNQTNNIEVISQANNAFEIRRYRSANGNTVPSSDARERITLIVYGEEGEVYDPSTPGGTKKVPFLPNTKLVAIANNVSSGYRVGMGSTVTSEDSNVVGYTHLAPTVEGGGTPGRWARLYTPKAEPWSLMGQGVSNIIPVIESPEKIAIASSDLS